ncbi:hypothetical protein Tco_0549310 [Tanacetum coccineum]
MNHYPLMVVRVVEVGNNHRLQGKEVEFSIEAPCPLFTTASSTTTGGIDVHHIETPLLEVVIAFNSPFGLKQWTVSRNFPCLKFAAAARDVFPWMFISGSRRLELSVRSKSRALTMSFKFSNNPGDTRRAICSKKLPPSAFKES